LTDILRRRISDSSRWRRRHVDVKLFGTESSQERTAELRRINEELRAKITERKNAAGALLSNEAQLKQAQAVAHLGGYEVDVLTGHTPLVR